MKALLCAYAAIFLLCLSGIGFYSCNSPAKPPVVNSKPVIKALDKKVFLEIVDTVAHLLSAKGSTAQQAIDLINSYRARYKFTINNQAEVRDTGNVFVNISNRPHSLFILFALTQNYRKQISYPDINNKFGQGKVDILPMEPVVIPVVYKLKGTDGQVHVTVGSEKFPDEKNNVIKYIIVSR